MSRPTDGRIRLAHVTLSLDTGGLEKLLVEFARHADRDRFDLHFVCLGFRGALADAIEACGWPVTTLDQPSGLRPSLVVRLARLLRRRRIDVVHSHDERPLFYAAMAAPLVRARLVHTQHHGKLESLSRKHIALLRFQARIADRFVCVSRDSARYFVELGLPAPRVSTLWNGIDLERFPYRGGNPTGPAVLVARLNYIKDIPSLLRATAQVIETCPDFRLEIAGAGPCQDDLERLTAALKLTGQVSFLGEVSDVPALLARARLFVLPSLSEGISLTLLEAMASGLPIVATRVGGNPEVVVSGKTGLLVPVQNPSALAEALLQVWQDPARAQDMGQAGRRRVEECFNIRTMLARYEAIYRAVCERGEEAREPVALGGN